MKSKRIYFWVFICLVPLLAVFVQYIYIKNKKTDARGDNYAGSVTCIKCHKDVYSSYLQTAHFESSRPASIHNIHGSFVKGQNEFAFNEHTNVVMEKRSDSLYQVAYEDGKEVKARPFDIIFGGRKAETYLYWKDKQLFELPISYFNNLHSWTNSPGYATKHPYFDRPIVQRCFECHSSYINRFQITSLLNQASEFDKKSLIYSIDCERCHGPAAEHVNFHTENPDEKKARYIVKYSSLTRAQKLDACAVCHNGGKDVYLESPFKFKMGDTLSKFREVSFFKQDPNPSTLDVHGNQTGLLASSKCFLMSNMDCSTCHNVHVNESSNRVLFSQRCIKCHNEINHNFCTASPKLTTAMRNNCIDCHMPLKPSNIISIASTGGKKEEPYMVRTHHIAIYPQESKKILAFINNNSAN